MNFIDKISYLLFGWLDFQRWTSASRRGKNKKWKIVLI